MYIRFYKMDINGTSNISEFVLLKIEEGSLIGVLILYLATTFLSILGNVLVVIVFCKGKRSKTDLRPFLINLAISDLLLAVFCMPFSFADAIFRTWMFTKPFCTFVLFIQMLSVAVSVFTNMAIGIDRLLVVLFPLRHRFFIIKYKYVIVSIWTSPSVLASVQFIVSRVKHYAPGVLVCGEVWPNTESRRIYTVFILLLTYLIPLLILVVTYSFVGCKLWKRISPGNRDHYRDFLQWRSKIKVNLVLL